MSIEFRFACRHLSLLSDIELGLTPDPGLEGVSQEVILVRRTASLPPVRLGATRVDLVAWDREGTWIRSPSGAEAYVSPSEILYITTSELSDVLTSRWLQVEVLPYLCAMHGVLLLHASAVVMDGGARLFLAASGSGKSTLAAAHSMRGHTIIADDLVLAGRHRDGRITVSGLRCAVALAPQSIELLGIRDERIETFSGISPKGKSFFRIPILGSDESVPIVEVYVLDRQKAEHPVPVRTDRLLLVLEHLSASGVTRRFQGAAHLETARAIASSGDWYRTTSESFLDSFQRDAPRLGPAIG